MTTTTTTATESDYYRTVIEGMRLGGWKVAHFRPALTLHGWRTAVQGDGAGFPDFVAVHPRRGVLFVELKRPKVKLTDAQTAWATALLEAGVVYILLTVPDGLDEFWQQVLG